MRAAVVEGHDELVGNVIEHRRGLLVTATLDVVQDAQRAPAGTACREGLFLQLSLCFSRACLGKLIGFGIKWLFKRRFRTVRGLFVGDACVWNIWAVAAVNISPSRLSKGMKRASLGIDRDGGDPEAAVAALR